MTRCLFCKSKNISIVTNGRDKVLLCSSGEILINNGVWQDLRKLHNKQARYDKLEKMLKEFYQPYVDELLKPKIEMFGKKDDNTKM